MPKTTIPLTTPANPSSTFLASVKSFCKIDITDDDALVTAYIMAAAETVNTKTQRCILTTTFDHFLDGFPFGGGYYNRLIRENPSIQYWLPAWAGILEIPRPPLQTLNYIKYIDTTNTEQTLDPSVYRVVPDPTLGLTTGASKFTNQFAKIFPLTIPQIGCVTINFTSGYADTYETLPTGLQVAIMSLCHHWYNHRMAVSDISMSEVPQTIDALLSPYYWGTYS